MGKACIAFQMERAEDAMKHLFSKARIVARYGDRFEGNWLHTWDEGERILYHCETCGGYFMLQSSEFHGREDDYYLDYFPVTGPKEAEELNRRWDGWQIEDKFPGRFLAQDNFGFPHWLEGVERGENLNMGLKKSVEVTESKEPELATVPDETLMCDIISSANPPIGDQHDAWKWAIGRLLYYKGKKCNDELLLMFHLNVLKLFDEYQKQPDEYFDAVGHNVPVLVTCFQLLQQHQNQRAKEYADPYLDYLEKHEELFCDGHLELDSDAEKAMYYEVYGERPEPKIRDDGIVMFLILYNQITKGILLQYKSDYEKKWLFTEKWMTRGLKLNPCCASLWIQLANNRTSSKGEEYDTAIQNALKFALAKEELSECYISLAMDKIEDDPKLAAALCVLAESYRAGFNAPRFVLSKKGVGFPSEESAVLAVKNSGIQIGLSKTAMKALGEN